MACMQTYLESWYTDLNADPRSTYTRLTFSDTLNLSTASSVTPLLPVERGFIIKWSRRKQHAIDSLLKLVDKRKLEAERIRNKYNDRIPVSPALRLVIDRQFCWEARADSIHHSASISHFHRSSVRRWRSPTFRISTRRSIWSRL